MTTPNTYVCAVCGGEFDKGWSDEEAAAELQKTHGGAPFPVAENECALVCDDCYGKIGFRKGE